MTTTHTPGAIRAAERIVAELIAPRPSAPIWACFRAQIADIIDRDTALPDLLAACEEAAQYMSCGEPSKGNGCIEPEGWAEVIEHLSAAIAKAQA